ncbi:hypothetical protein ACES2L_00245 [Bdellovibrio bacteriovorus]
MRLERILPLAVLALSFCWPSHLGGLKFIPIYEALTIKAQKNSPPHVAFEEVLESEKDLSEWARIEQLKPLTLAVERNSSTPVFSKKVALPEMVLQKSVERINFDSQNVAEADSGQWIDQLPPKQALRLQEAQRRSEVLGQDWSVPTWSDMAKEVLEKSGVLVHSAPSKSVYVAGSGNKTQLSGPKVQFPTNQSAAAGSDNEASFAPANTLIEERALGKSIVGPLEITGGLAITNEHHIEIRRNDEGVLKELGRVDLIKGLYNIDVEDTSGSVVARLVDKDGKTLGEGSFKLSRLVGSDEKSVQGPAIKIAPRPDFAGIIASAYNSKPNDVAPSSTRATFVKGVSEVSVKKDGYASMDNVAKGSSTVLRAAAPNHLQTSAIILSGAEFKTQLFPESMINALLDIVSQQRNQSFEASETIIWGKVSLDGKTVSGIEVSVESDPSLVPIYFNQFMLPDPTLKATSENGLYAFIGAAPGFHSLLAVRSNAIFGYMNVVVDEGALAEGNIDATIRNESVPLRVFDAFTGEAKNAVVTLQSLTNDVNVENGVTTVSLPSVARVGMMRVQPEGSDYVAARYLYNDTDSFLHLPLVQWPWINSIKTYLKIDDTPTSGIIVGFVPDEDFEVHLAAYDNFESRFIVYFDMQGRILQTGKGIAGGGFILYNVPEDTHEVVVLGQRSGRIYSRVLPVDANSLSVLSFR